VLIFRFVVISSLLFSIAFAASEQRPSSEAQIQKAVARGKEVRNHRGVLSDVLQNHAMVMKAGDVRCGFATIRIEDAKGEGGGVYTMIETFKAASAEGDETATIDYNATFLLGADLGLISGNATSTCELSNRTDKKQQATISTLSLSVKDDVLSYERVEQKNGDTAPSQKESKKIALHGVRPVPNNALSGVAVFVREAAKDGWKPDVKDALCVPVFNLAADPDSLSFNIDPVWITFDAPVYTNPKGTAVQMAQRFLAGDITEKGMEVEPPAPNVWQNRQLFPLDVHLHPLAQPCPGDPRIKVEVVEPAAVDLTSPLDLEKISAAMKNAGK
jgi:hypothetical protein